MFVLFVLFSLEASSVVFVYVFVYSPENLYFVLLVLIFYGTNSMVINNVKQQDELPKFNDKFKLSANMTSCDSGLPS